MIRPVEFDLRPLQLADFDVPNEAAQLFIQLAGLGRIMGSMTDLLLIKSDSSRTDVWLLNRAFSRHALNPCPTY